MDFLLDILSDGKQVSARKMFGEYCLYYAGRPVGLVCDEQLYLKPTEAGKRLMKALTVGAPFPGARPHLLVSPDDWDDRSWLNALVRATFDGLPPSKVPKPRATAKPQRTAELESLPNLGPKSQAMLASVHIDSVAKLSKLGAVAAYAQVKQSHRNASLNLLWALEGALTGLPWQVVAREYRTSLLLALEQHQNAKVPISGHKRKNG
ncbi:TfoX/Sxy family DNA transformation protein [Rhodoferax lacus]|nr:TfoX/Sxy family DNA transformation protein [Rhodoferax lacus]